MIEENDEIRMTNDELPNGWELIKLQDIASWGSGGTPPRKNPKYYGGDIPWIKTGELGDGLILDTEEKITAEGLKNSSAKVFPKGSVAIAMYGATIGKVSILGIDAATNQACAVGIPDLRVTGPQYIFQYLRSQKDAFIAAGKGGAQPNLSQGVIKEWPFPLAPLAEQKRIADKLELVLGRVDACRARLDRVPALLKRFRQSVLAAATSGKLTEEWRMTNGVNNEWETVKVGGLLTDIRYGTAKKCHYEPVATPVLRIPNIGAGHVSLDDIKYANFDEKEIGTLSLKSGDLLMIRSNGSVELVGRIALVSEKEAGYLYAGYLIRLRINETQALSAYVAISLRSPATRSIIELNARSSSGVNNINAEEIKALEINLPTLPEQLEIVRRVEALFAFADRIEARLATAQKTVERLTPATLAKAFRGELVPQDPNDEPASALLIRLTKNRTKTLPKRTVLTRETGTDHIERTYCETHSIFSYDKYEKSLNPKTFDIRVIRAKESPRVPKENAAMTKSRFDDDVEGQPYLTNLIRQAANPQDATELFKMAQLSIVDFYKQLTWEVDRGLIKEDGKKLQAVS